MNGLRACAKKGFADWLAGSAADVVGVQEVRALPEQLPAEITRPEGYDVRFSSAKRKGYSGVGLFSRRSPTSLDTELGVKRFDVEGRVQIARFGKLVVANIYFPNGNGKERDNSRVPYKLAFYRKLLERLEELRRKRYRVLVMGDFNTAHTEIDLARPKQNRKTSGFLPKECAEFDRWVDAGWGRHLSQLRKRGWTLQLVESAVGGPSPKHRLAHRLHPRRRVRRSGHREECQAGQSADQSRYSTRRFHDVSPALVEIIHASFVPTFGRRGFSAA